MKSERSRMNTYRFTLEMIVCFLSHDRSRANLIAHQLSRDWQPGHLGDRSHDWLIWLIGQVFRWAALVAYRRRV